MSEKIFPPVYIIFVTERRKNELFQINGKSGLKVLISTAQRHIHILNLKYKNACHEIVLSQKHKERRIELINEWISKNHNWEKPIFSDEKRF